MSLDGKYSQKRSREVWLKEGDRNSKFFHVSTVIKRRRNQILTVKSEICWLSDEKEIGNFFFQNFQHLYASDNS